MAFVLLPCDLPTWPTVAKYLGLLRNVDSSSAFTKLFHELFDYCNVGINIGSFESTPKEYFGGLAKFLQTEAADEFFTITLPAMVDFALNIATLRPPAGLQYSLQQENRTFILSRGFTASLLAHTFFCTMPRRTKNSHPTLTDPNFAPILSSLYRESQRVKLKCFFHYFNLLSAHKPGGAVTFSRKVMDQNSNFISVEEWRSSSEPLCSFILKKNEKLQDCIEDDILLTCFTSPDISRPTLTGQNSQQAETMMAFPEILVTAVVCEHLEANEAYQIMGALRVAIIIDLDSRPTCILLDTFEQPNIVHNLVDAQNYSSDPNIQYENANMMRELNKFYVSVSSQRQSQSSDDGDSFSSSSEFISVSRQHSDVEDSGAPRDEILSSNEDLTSIHEKTKRIKHFCLKGFSQPSKRYSKGNRTLSLNEASSYESEDITYQVLDDKAILPCRHDLPVPSGLPLSGKREGFALSRKVNSSISSDGIKSLNRNVHRKRKKKKWKSYDSSEDDRQHLTAEKIRQGETSSTEVINQNSSIFYSCDIEDPLTFVEKENVNPEMETKGELQKNGNTFQKRNLKETPSSTVESDYLTAEINVGNQDSPKVNHSKEIKKEKETKSLMEKVFKAILNIDSEKEEKGKTNLNKEISKQNFQNSDNIPVETEASSAGNTFQKAKTAHHEDEKTNFFLCEKKVTQKPPLPKSAKSRVPSSSLPGPSSPHMPPAMLPVAVPLTRRGSSFESKAASSNGQNCQDRGFATHEEESYFSAFESFEKHEAIRQPPTPPPKRKYKMKGKETARKSSFADRLKETLSRGFSCDSVTKDCEPQTPPAGTEKDDISSRCKNEGEPRPFQRPMVRRQISADISFEDDETLEPFSRRFHGHNFNSYKVPEDYVAKASRGTSEDEKNENESLEKEFSDDSSDSVSSRYSFSSDYPSDFNEVYATVEEILQPMGEKVLGPRGLAVKRFSNSILKRALSENYKGMVFSLSGLSVSSEALSSTRSFSHLSEFSTKDSGFSDKVKFPKNYRKNRTPTFSYVISGNWGCGRLKGDPQIKVMLQWAATSRARKASFCFCPHGREELTQLSEVLQKIKQHKWSVGELIDGVLKFASLRRLVYTLKNPPTTSNELSETSKRNYASWNLPNLFQYILNFAP